MTQACPRLIFPIQTQLVNETTAEAAPRQLDLVTGLCALRLGIPTPENRRLRHGRWSRRRELGSQERNLVRVCGIWVSAAVVGLRGWRANESVAGGLGQVIQTDVA